ncbi:MAG: N-acetyltransferase [Tannerellaceae bacterium]|jgi:UDP-2-acetamido-3-amino-2,3-dideoxy-glucuronate N-acetyltransferase|nr:N-acetyltransferase [Tannerellaceae bacterium]
MATYQAHETAIIDPGCTIGDDTQIWHFSHLMAGCRVGRACRIGQNVVVSPGVVLGNNVKVQNNVSIYSGVTCEDDVFLGPSCVFTNITNPRSAVPRNHLYRETLVRQGATIGANATVLCGNVIGRYALIGAGAVITRHVPPYALMTGNPARQTGWVSEFGLRLHFNEAGMAICPESRSRYLLEAGEVRKLDG